MCDQEIPLRGSRRPPDARARRSLETPSYVSVRVRMKAGPYTLARHYAGGFISQWAALRPPISVNAYAAGGSQLDVVL